jgi:hypothetical protein
VRRLVRQILLANQEAPARPARLGDVVADVARSPGQRFSSALSTERWVYRNFRLEVHFGAHSGQVRRWRGRMSRITLPAMLT